MKLEKLQKQTVLSICCKFDIFSYLLYIFVFYIFAYICVVYIFIYLCFIYLYIFSVNLLFPLICFQSLSQVQRFTVVLSKVKATWELFVITNNPNILCDPFGKSDMGQQSQLLQCLFNSSI